MRMSIIDPDDRFAEVVRVAFEAELFAVERYADAATALASIANRSFDLFLVEVDLPVGEDVTGEDGVDQNVVACHLIGEGLGQRRQSRTERAADGQQFHGLLGHE